MASLDGNVNAHIGPGQLNEIGRTGEMFAKLFSLVKVQNILFGRLGKDLRDKGLPFQKINAQTTFGKGTLNLAQADFHSDAIDAKCQGTIDFVNQRLNLNVFLKPMATVDKALQIVPLVGKAAESITEIRIDIEGSLEDPKIHAAPIKQFGEIIEDGLKAPATILENIGEDLKKIF